MPASKRKSVTLRGIGVSPGVVIGPVFLVASRNIKVLERRVSKDEIGSEIARFEDALIETRSQLRDIQSDLEKRDLLGDVGFLDAHLMVLDDRSFIEEVVNGVQEQRKNVEVLVQDVIRR
jgi:phosphotransferase system enzyme I (PtsI)